MGLLCCPMLCGIWVAGCTSSVQVGLDSPEALGRSLAIREAGEARSTASVPLIVDRLEDEDEAVRMYAILALERITGQRFGYDYGKSAAGRAPAVERWREFVRNGRHLTRSGNDEKPPVVQAPGEAGPADEQAKLNHERR